MLGGCKVDEWLDQALAYPGVCLLDLTPKICIKSTQIPGEFHRDPEDEGARTMP